MRDRRTSLFTRGLLPVFLFALFTSLCIGLCGCSGGGADEDSVKVFYLNSDRTGILSKPVRLTEEAVTDRAGELLKALSADQPEEGLAGPIRKFEVNDYRIEGSTITVDFSRDYKKLDLIAEKLTRAAIVNTLCGLDEIRRVTIRVNGALLVDERGNKSENMTSDQFIYNSGSEMLNFERTEMHLYFASKDGKNLVETYRTVVYNGNIPMERLVVEQIIKGPKGDFNYPTVNPDTRLINILTRDDICTVTFDRTFLTNPNPVESEVALYSIVNSLTELPSIRQVQILIDGEDHPVFMNHYSLDPDSLLQKNTSLLPANN